MLHFPAQHKLCVLGGGLFGPGPDLLVLAMLRCESPFVELQEGHLRGGAGFLGQNVDHHSAGEGSRLLQFLYLQLELPRFVDAVKLCWVAT